MSLLARRAATTPDRTALVDAADGRRWRYRDLDTLVDRAVDRLRERAPGTERVGTIFHPTPAFVVTFHAAQRLGWTVVGLDSRSPVSELETHVERAEIDHLVHGPDVALPPAVETPATAASDLIERGGHHAVGGTAEGDDPAAVTAGVDRPGLRPADPAETAVILFTSGTTGRQKAVRLTWRNLHASAVASAFRLGVSPGDRWLCCLPVNHMGGLAPVVRTALYGTTLVVQRAFDAEATAHVLAEHDVTGVSLVPTQLRRLLDADAPLGDLETVLVGGAPTPEHLLDRALAADAPVAPTYGLTEAASQVATARPATAAAYPGTVGQPLYGVRVTVVADGDPVPAGERGELVVSGPTVTPGYLDPERTAAAFGEWGLHTGDIGVRDEAGRLRVLGRRDDLVSTGGELVAPDEVVETLCAHPAVAEAAVVGIDDEEWGQRLAALVVPERDLDVSTVDEHCRDSLPGYRCPRTVALADSIPRTLSGTVDREAVRDRLRNREG